MAYNLSSGTKILFPDLRPTELLKDTDTTWPCQGPAHLSQAAAETSTLQWFRSMGVPEPKVTKHGKARFDIVAGLGYRHLKTQHYFLGAEILHLTWLIDDTLEGSSPNYVLTEISALKQVFRGSIEHCSDSLLVKLLRSWWNRALDVLMPQDSVARWWCASVERYWDSLYLEALERHSTKILNYQQYLELRRRTIGIDSTINFFVLGEDFETEIFEKPLLTGMFATTLDLLLLENDIESYNKEQAAGDGRAEHNAVEAVMSERKCGLQEAFDFLTDKYSNLFLKLMSLYDTEVRPNLESMSDVELTYINGLLAWVEANVKFSTTCPRYHRPGEASTGIRLIEIWPGAGVSSKSNQVEIEVASRFTIETDKSTLFVIPVSG